MSQYNFATINGWSMMPFLKKGDIVLHKNKSFQPGSIIIFHYGDLILTHRLIKQNDKLLTKGDNIPYWDRIINPEDVIGVAEYVIRNHKIIDLNIKFSNQFSLFYAKLEMKLITFMKNIFNSRSFVINEFVKLILFPLWGLSYILYICNSKTHICKL